MSEPRASLLVIDDEPNILSALRRLLRREELDATFCDSPDEALELIDARVFDVVVSDYRMPGVSGIDLMERVRETQPDAVRMILTGYADIQAAIEAINRGAVYRFLTKPWDDDELVAEIREAVARSRMIRDGELPAHESTQ